MNLPMVGMSVGQDEQAKSLIRLLKQYRRERANARARAVIAIAISALARELAEMPDANVFAPPAPQRGP